MRKNRVALDRRTPRKLVLLVGLVLALVMSPAQSTRHSFNGRASQWRLAAFTQVQYGEGFDSCTQSTSNGYGGNLTPGQLSDFWTNSPYYNFYFT